jgi:hypothetical protein
MQEHEKSKKSQPLRMYDSVWGLAMELVGYAEARKI